VALLSAFEIPSLVCSTYKVQRTEISWNDNDYQQDRGVSQGTDHQAINHHIHTDGANPLLITILGSNPTRCCVRDDPI
jgi:hypothetical protein